MSITEIASLARRGSGTAVATRLSALAPLEAHSVALLESLGSLRSVPAGVELIDERGFPPRALFIVKGWVARVRGLPDGRRQILSVLLPGDALGLCFRPHPLALGSAVSLTPVQLLDASPVVAAIESGQPQWRDLDQALHVSAGMHEAYLLDQVTRLGRMTAYERLSHLFLELRDRLELAGLSAGRRFPMPLTQETLADATGLSTVHVNRTLQQLRRDGELDLRHGSVTLNDPEALAQICDYHQPAPSRWLSRP